MAFASHKSPNIDKILTEITGVDRIETIEFNMCTFCHGEAIEFKDALSKREYEISGLCQTCQDKVW